MTDGILHSQSLNFIFHHLSLDISILYTERERQIDRERELNELEED